MFYACCIDCQYGIAACSMHAVLIGSTVLLHVLCMLYRLRVRYCCVFYACCVDCQYGIAACSMHAVLIASTVLLRVLCMLY